LCHSEESSRETAIKDYSLDEFTICGLLKNSIDSFKHLKHFTGKNMRGKMTKKQDSREAFSLCGVFNLFVFPVSKLFSAAFFQQMKCVFGEDKSFL